MRNSTQVQFLEVGLSFMASAKKGRPVQGILFLNGCISKPLQNILGRLYLRASTRWDSVHDISRTRQKNASR